MNDLQNCLFLGKLPGRTKRTVSNSNLEVMDYQRSFNYDDWTNERRLADQIMVKVQELSLPLKLDQLTRGRGDCFIISILQQCNRPEIRWRVAPNIQRLAREMDQMGFRMVVRNFVVNANNA